MSGKIRGFPKDSQIINPMARPILKLEVNDQLQSQLDCPNVHPREAAKVLCNVVIDLIFGYSEAVADAQSKVVRPPDEGGKS